MCENTEGAQPERKSMAGTRGITRLYAVQMMYRAEQEGCSVLDFLKELSGNEPPEVILTENVSLTDIDKEFYRNLVTVAHEHLSEIDKTIAAHLQKSWSFERLDMITKNILRLATAELLFIPEIPNNVTFNEYIEIAKAFFEDKSEVSFINGILNKISER